MVFYENMKTGKADKALSRSSFISLWVYVRLVIPFDACPTSLSMHTSLAPALSSKEVKVCRQSWGVCGTEIPDCNRAFLNNGRYRVS